MGKIIVRNERQGIEYWFQKAYNDFINHPPKLLYTGHMNFSVDDFARPLVGIMCHEGMFRYQRANALRETL